jgi:hypothetical protein
MQLEDKCGAIAQQETKLAESLKRQAALEETCTAELLTKVCAFMASLPAKLCPKPALLAVNGSACLVLLTGWTCCIQVPIPVQTVVAGCTEACLRNLCKASLGMG